MTQPDWNPDLYLKFGKERTQPAIDLIARLDVDHPETIIDIGCGPGNSTQVLAAKWPHAKIVGTDISPAMIEKAKQDFPDGEWMLFDARKDEMNRKFDLIFSNAAIQWIPDHKKLIERFSDLLKEKGAIAVQVPQFWDMPLGASTAEIAGQHRWVAKTAGVRNLFTNHNHTFYYDCLSEHFTDITIWETWYMHIMESHRAILEMIRSTGLKPYLERLPDEKERFAFRYSVLESIRQCYPAQKDGKVIFPFKRLFFIAKR